MARRRGQGTAVTLTGRSDVESPPPLTRAFPPRDAHQLPIIRPTPAFHETPRNSLIVFPSFQAGGHRRPVTVAPPLPPPPRLRGQVTCFFRISFFFTPAAAIATAGRGPRASVRAWPSPWAPSEFGERRCWRRGNRRRRRRGRRRRRAEAGRGRGRVKVRGNTVGAVARRYGRRRRRRRRRRCSHCRDLKPWTKGDSIDPRSLRAPYGRTF